MEKAQVRNDISLSIVLSILGGVFIIIGGLSLLVIFSWHSSMFGGMMGGGWPMFRSIYPFWLLGIMTAVSISAGSVVMAAAYKMHREPENKQKLGFLVIIASIVGLLCAGGFGLGGIIGVIGGLIALSGRF